MPWDYPPVAFYFGVRLDGAPANADASFQEVSGIRVELGSETVVEGGENRFVHRLPKAPTYSNLVLKRGVVVTRSVMADWVANTLRNVLSQPIKPRHLTVTLKNEQHQPLIQWLFVDAYPVRWETSPFDSMQSSILTESLEFAYHFFNRTVVRSSAR
jgi:phage tail-like protein